MLQNLLSCSYLQKGESSDNSEKLLKTTQSNFLWNFVSNGSSRKEKSRYTLIYS